MRIGIKGIKLIKFYESLHDGDLTKVGLQPKMDPIGIWTEGWGRAMRDSKGNFLRGAGNKANAYNAITIHNLQEADAAFANDIAPREYAVIQKLKIIPTQNQFDALVSHFYNTGGSSTLFKLVNERASEDEIRSWWQTKYITASGRTLPGLVKRRKAEADLFFSK